MTTDTIRHLGAEFHHAADGVGEALRRLEHARADRLAFLRRCSKDSAARLAALKEEIRTLPEQIAKWDAEAARLESQTAEDLLRQALEPLPKCDGDHKGPLCADKQCWLRCPDCGKGEHYPAACAVQEQPKPEPYRAGLPPERLRKVWADWEAKGGTIYSFDGETYRCNWWSVGAEKPIDHTAEKDWLRQEFRPHGATWSRVEAMADEAEGAAAPKMLDLRTVRDDSNHTNPDVVMADADLFDAGETAATKAPLIRKGETFTVEREVSDHGKGPRVKVTREGQGQCYIAALQPAHVVPTPPAPTLLNLTKLPPGTVCEATATIRTADGDQFSEGARFTVTYQEPQTYVGLWPTSADFDPGPNNAWLPALVPARVVKEGGEQ